MVEDFGPGGDVSGGSGLSDETGRCCRPNALDIAQLISDHHGALYRYAYRLTGSQADAEDLTQQAYLVAQQKLHQLRHPEKVDRWLFAVLRSCYLKGKRKRRPIAASSLELNVEHIPEETPTGDQIDRQRLQAALDELPREFKVVLGMFYFEQCSYKEIARQLRIPIGTVMSRLARAKARLRRKLLGGAERRNEAAGTVEATFPTHPGK
jgi:RNA polymerase sigma-70 factor (ECF subfamily)